jgi:4-carboxymuconolactone decarboxylase
VKKHWGVLIVLFSLAGLVPAAMGRGPAPLPGPENALGSQAAPTSESVIGHDRMPEIPVEKMTDEQKKAAEHLRKGRGTPLFGPYIALLRSPDLMVRVQAMGDYLRFKPALPPKLRELAIIYTARMMTQQFEWGGHAANALEEGLSPEIAKAISEGRRPARMTDEEALVYDFCAELHRTYGVSDATYARAVSALGEQGVVDLVALNGYYMMIGMILNVAHTPMPKGSVPLLRPFPQ